MQCSVGAHDAEPWLQWTVIVRIEFPFDTCRSATDMLYAGVLERFPDITFILSHAGGALPALVPRLPSIGTLDWLPHPEGLNPAGVREQLARLYFDTAIAGFEANLAPVLALTSADHIVFGTDYPPASEGVIELNLAALDALTLQVAQKFPDHQLILGHAGIPVVSKLDDYQAAWRTALRKLAAAPNVGLKISGLSSAAPPNFYAITMRNWIRECVETFGPDRSMFGSNFHVERLFVTLPKLFRTYRRAVDDYSPAEQDQMFCQTAERIVRI